MVDHEYTHTHTHMQHTHSVAILLTPAISRWKTPVVKEKGGKEKTRLILSFRSRGSKQRHEDCSSAFAVRWWKDSYSRSTAPLLLGAVRFPSMNWLFYEYFFIGSFMPTQSKTYFFSFVCAGKLPSFSLLHVLIKNP